MNYHLTGILPSNVGAFSKDLVGVRQLFVMRHVEAGAIKCSGGDIARNITKHGRAVAAAAKQHLDERGFQPDAILVSSSERTRQTAEIACADFDVELEFTNQLYLANLEDLVRFLRELDDDLQNVLLIGHNNGISDLVTYLSGVTCSLGTGDIAELSSKSLPWGYSMSRCLWTLEDSWHPLKAI